MIFPNRRPSNKLLAVFALAIGLRVVNASAMMFINDAFLGGGEWGNYTLYLSQSIPPGEGNFAISILYYGADITLTYYGIAELYSLHDVDYGLEFTPAYVNNDSPPLLSNNNNPGSASLSIPVDESIYLGYWDDRSPWEQTPSDNDLYGWIELYNTGSGLAILDGATAAGGGIIVGTYSQIPEPSTLTLLCLGAGTMILRRKRNQI